jgi:deazaflavin-dependent oxidoreductase (nitroreductase family)
MDNSGYARFSMRLPAWALRAIGRLNVPVYRATRGRLMNTVGTAPVMLLTTTGRKSGQERTAPVLYLRDGDRLVVVGSNAGNAKPPAWALNLRANPDARAQVGGRRWPVRARVADGPERADLWKRVNDLYEGFDDYAERASRDIAVFVLEPR